VSGKDIKQVDSIVVEFKMTAEDDWGFRDYIHEQKEAGNYGSKKNGDYTYQELRQLAREFLGLTDE
jgi:hypothetical protein